MAIIELLGDDNHVLIDDNFKNLINIAKGNVTFPVPTSTSVLGSYTTVSYTLSNATPPLLAVRSTFPSYVQSVTKSGNTYTWTLVCDSSGRGGTAEYFVFTLPEVVPDAGGLVQLRNKDNQLVFDSSLKYCKVEKLFSYNLDSNANTGVNPLRKYAAFTCVWPGEYGAIQYPPLTNPPLYGVAETQKRMGIAFSSSNCSATNFTFVYRTYATSNPVTNTWRNGSGMALIIDVTGI